MNQPENFNQTFLLLGRLTDTNLRDIYLTRFLNVISEKTRVKESNFVVSFAGEPVVLESSTKDLEVNEGDSVTLICNAQGFSSADLVE